MDIALRYRRLKYLTTLTNNAPTAFPLLLDLTITDTKEWAVCLDAVIARLWKYAEGESLPNPDLRQTLEMIRESSHTRKQIRSTWLGREADGPRWKSSEKKESVQPDDIGMLFMNPLVKRSSVHRQRYAEHAALTFAIGRAYAVICVSCRRSACSSSCTKYKPMEREKAQLLREQDLAEGTKL